ncbi:hypothetical protein AT278_17845 [Bacillus cereus]|uniref:hypothetical protein n=1 Tax=Bacillus sp. FSL W8-0640 TaxID=2978210 RepID=UPI00077A5EB0|nr:hypothetical protein AT278_17845 [Bacillus cereus]
MKSLVKAQLNINSKVAPHIGVWIEITSGLYLSGTLIVAPYMGAWIEIQPFHFLAWLPNVAPYIGAWIEMGILSL